MPVSPGGTLTYGSESFGSCALGRCLQWLRRGPTATPTSRRFPQWPALWIVPRRRLQAGSTYRREPCRRLARLIWNGEPDQPLRDAATKGRLRDTQALREQVRRMLSDTKSSALVAGFFDTWLSLDQLATTKGDNKLFPEFDDELRGAFRRETELFVESQLREDRNPLDLWTANYTFLNERLARHYGIPNVSGPEYRRVTWPGPERAGLLAQGSILTLTSRAYNAYPVDVPTTSPAMRAKWILTRFLGVNPPTPLPNIPPKDFPFEKHTPLVKQSRTFPATPVWRVIEFLPAVLRAGEFRRPRTLALRLRSRSHRCFRSNGRRNNVQRPRGAPSRAARAPRRVSQHDDGKTHGVYHRRQSGDEPTHSGVAHARRPRRPARSGSPGFLLVLAHRRCC